MSATRDAFRIEMQRFASAHLIFHRKFHEDHHALHSAYTKWAEQHSMAKPFGMGGTDFDYLLQEIIHAHVGQRFHTMSLKFPTSEVMGVKLNEES